MWRVEFECRVLHSSNVESSDLPYTRAGSMTKRRIQFDFKPLAESDLQLLFEWLNRPHVAQWWNGPISLTEIRDKYLPRLNSTSVRPYFAHVNGIPIGFAQSCVVMAQQDSGW